MVIQQVVIDDPILQKLVAAFEEASQNVEAFQIFDEIIQNINLDKEKDEHIITYLQRDVYPHTDLFKAVELLVKTGLALNNYHGTDETAENIRYLEAFDLSLTSAVARAQEEERARARASENGNQQAGKRRRRRRSKRNRKNKSKKQSSKTKRNRSKKRSRSKRRRT